MLSDITIQFSAVVINIFYAIQWIRKLAAAIATVGNIWLLAYQFTHPGRWDIV